MRRLLLLAGLATILPAGAAWASDAPPAPAATRTLVVKVTIGGGMKDAPKKPLAGATVLVYGASLDGKDRTATTDASGAAQVAGIASPEVTVRVDADRYVGEEQEVDLEKSPGKPLEVELTPGFPFDGTVLDDETGKPIAGARVDVEAHGAVGGYMSQSFRPPYARTTTDAQGRFHVNGVAEGQVATIAATAKGHGAAGVSIRILGGNVTPSPVVVRLPVGGSVVGTVRDEQGHAIAGATVYVFPASSERLRENPRGWFQSSTGEREQAARAISGGDGRYVVDGLPLAVEYAAAAEADGFALSGVVDGLRVAASTPEARADIALQRAAVLLVSLVDLAGKKVTEPARVEVGTGGFGSGDREEKPHHSNVYRFTPVDPGEVSVTVTAPSYRPTWVKTTIEAAKTTEVTVKLDPGVSIEGTVVGEDGKPVDGGTIEVETVGGNDPGPFGWTTVGGRMFDVGADGRFVARGLAEKDVELTARTFRGAERDSYWTLSKVKVSPPAKDLRVVVVQRGSAVIKILGPDGKPFTGKAMVMDGVKGESSSGSVHEIKDGVEVFTGLDEKLCTIDIAVAGFLPVHREFRAKLRTRIDLGTVTLDVGLPVKGRVVDLDGKPVSGAHVSGSHATIAADEQGEFILKNEPRGKGRISAEAEGFLEATVDVDVMPAASPVEIRLARGALLRGTLHAADGTPLQQEFYAWRIGADGKRVGTAEEEISPEEDGQFSHRLAAGRYRFVLPSKGDAESPPNLGEFDLKEGETREVEFKLPK